MGGEFLPSTLPHYTKVLQLGDSSNQLLLEGMVIVEEKLDGSQFRFGKLGGRLLFGSRQVDFPEGEPPDNMFLPAVEYLTSIGDRVPDGWVFFAEFLAKPKQNTLVYARTPKNHLMLFDAFCFETSSWASMKTLCQFARGFEIDPPNLLHFDGSSLIPGNLIDQSLIDQQLKTVSYLGEALMEGVVIKNYSQESGDRYHKGPGFACGKFVSPEFKEENRANWRAQSDIVGQIVARFKVPTRWEKAVQHVRESTGLEGSMRDMRPLLVALDKDIAEEIRAEAERMLFDHFERDITKGIKAGFAEWYKRRLSEEILK